MDVVTGRTVDEMGNGQHQSLVEYAFTLDNSSQKAAEAVIGFFHGFAAYTFVFLGYILGRADNGQDFKDMWQESRKDAKEFIEKHLTGPLENANKYLDDCNLLDNDAVKEVKDDTDAYIDGAGVSLSIGLPVPSRVSDLYKCAKDVGLFKKAPDLPSKELFKLKIGGFKRGVEYADVVIGDAVDPPLSDILLARVPGPTQGPVRASRLVHTAAAMHDTALQATLAVTGAEIDGNATGNWTSDAQRTLSFSQVAPLSGTLYATDGTALGSGAIALQPQGASTSVAVAGLPITSTFVGGGNVASYAAGLDGLGAGSAWDTYMDTLGATQPYTLALQDVVATVNGTSTYTGSFTLVTTDMPSFTGSGHTAAPTFARTAAYQTADGQLAFGPASGTFQAGSTSLDASTGVALSGYDGPITVTAVSPTSEQVTLAGSASFFTLHAAPASSTVAPGAASAFQAKIDSNADDTYTTTVEAPAGWTVALDATGLVTATPPLGTTPGDYQVRVTAQSGAHPSLFASAVHTITVTTAQGVALTIAPDPQFTVPWGLSDPNATTGDTNDGRIQLTGAAFTVDVTNTSTMSHTFNLSESGLPDGWALLSNANGQSSTTLSLSPGGVGQVGLYISPTVTMLPPAGTVAPFTVRVAATDDSNSALTGSASQSFTVPAIAFSQVTASPATIVSSPGLTTTFQLAVRNVGNIAGTFPLSLTLPISDWTAAITSPLTLDPGQAVTQTVTVQTPDGDLGRDYPVLIESPSNGYVQSTEVSVHMTSLAAQAVDSAAQTVGQLFPSDLSLSAGLVYLGQTVETFQIACQHAITLTEPGAADCATDLRDHIVSAAQQVAAAAGAESPRITANNDIAQTAQTLGATTTVSAIDADITALQGQVTALQAQLTEIAEHNAQVSFMPGRRVVLDGKPAAFDLRLTNTGSVTTTYPLTLTASSPSVAISPTSAAPTLAPGATITVPVTATTPGLGSWDLQADVGTSGVADLAPLRARAGLTAVDALLRVTGVRAAPSFVEYGPGGAAAQVVVQVANVADEPISGTARLRLLDATGTEVYSATQPLAISDALAPVDYPLGTITTTNLITGAYTLAVDILDANGQIIPKASGQGVLAVGQAVTAGSSVLPSLAAPGDITATTSLTTALNLNALETQQTARSVVAGRAKSARTGDAMSKQPSRRLTSQHLAVESTARTLRVRTITSHTVAIPRSTNGVSQHPKRVINSAPARPAIHVKSPTTSATGRITSWTEQRPRKLNSIVFIQTASPKLSALCPWVSGCLLTRYWFSASNTSAHPVSSLIRHERRAYRRQRNVSSPMSAPAPTATSTAPPAATATLTTTHRAAITPTAIHRATTTRAVGKDAPPAWDFGGILDIGVSFTKRLATRPPFVPGYRSTPTTQPAKRFSAMPYHATYRRNLVQPGYWLPAATGARRILPAASQETDVCGTITTDTHWTLAGSPYVLTCYVQVSTGVTLTIDPGVVVEGSGNVGLYIQGVLLAQGAVDLPITFTSAVSPASAGDWTGLFLDGAAASGSRLSHVTIADAGRRYGAPYGYGYENGFGGWLCAAGSGPGGSNGYNCEDEALLLRDASPTLDHLTVRDSNGQGLYLQGSGTQPSIDQLTVAGAAYQGLYADGTVPALQLKALFLDNANAAIELANPNTLTGLNQNTFKGNGVDGVQLDGGTLTGQVSVSPADVGQLKLANTVTVGSSAALTLTAGTTVLGNGGLDVQGSLTAIGTSAQPISFTSGSATLSPGDWPGLTFEPGSLGYLDYAALTYAATAIAANNAAVTIHHSTLTADSVGISNCAACADTPVHAENNYWGAPDGPAPNGHGPGVTSNVIVDPFETSSDLASTAFTPTYTLAASLDLPAQTTGVGGVATYRLGVRDTGNVPNTVAISLTGLDPSWYTFAPTNFSLVPGQIGQATLTVQPPTADCSTAGTHPFTLTIGSAGNGATRDVTGTLTLTPNPAISTLAPDDGATIGSTDALFSWQTSVTGTATLRIWPSADPGNVQTYTATTGLQHQARVTGLSRNTDYTWSAHAETACGHADSEPRTLHVGNGLVFSQRAYNPVIERDYNQQATLQVTNQDDVSHTLLLTNTVPPAGDLIAGFIGLGSTDGSMTLLPGQTRDVTLGLAAQDAQSRDYDLIAGLTADAGTAAPIQDAVPVHVHVHIPDIRFSLQEILHDTTALTRTFRITNHGDPLTDLALTVASTGTGTLYFVPGIAHGHLDTGQSVDVDAYTSVGSDFRALTATVMAAAAGVTQTLPVTESLPADKAMYLGEVQNTSMEVHNQDWYCTNRPIINDVLSLPSGFRRDEMTSGQLRLGLYPTGVTGEAVRPHNLDAYVNDNRVGGFQNQIPDGVQSYPVQPSYLNEAAFGPSQDNVRLVTTHLNGGHYVVATDLSLSVCLAHYREWVAAGSQDDANRIVSARSFLIPPAKTLKVQILTPASGHVQLGQPVHVTARVIDDIGRAWSYIVAGQASDGSGQFLLYDDGQHGDGDARDGVYGGTWVPAKAGPVNLGVGTATCTLSGADAVSVTVDNPTYTVDISHTVPVSGVRVLGDTL